MKFQLFCGTLTLSMIAAGASHWWSVNQLVSAVRGGLPLPAQAVAPAEQPATSRQLLTVTSALPTQSTGNTQSPQDPYQKKFYENLIRKMEGLQNQNRDLLDQLAETNRDLMKLEFRVDTHSESFRPLPVNEELREISSGNEFTSGVLPPKAQPVEESTPFLE